MSAVGNISQLASQIADWDRLDTVAYLLIQGVLVALIVLPLLFKGVIGLTPGSAPFGAVI